MGVVVIADDFFFSENILLENEIILYIELFLLMGVPMSALWEETDFRPGNPSIKRCYFWKITLYLFLFSNTLFFLKKEGLDQVNLALNTLYFIKPKWWQPYFYKITLGKTQRKYFLITASLHTHIFIP